LKTWLFLIMMLSRIESIGIYFFMFGFLHNILIEVAEIYFAFLQEIWEILLWSRPGQGTLIIILVRVLELLHYVWDGCISSFCYQVLRNLIWILNIIKDLFWSIK
jgi:hypothetical protein